MLSSTFKHFGFGGYYLSSLKYLLVHRLFARKNDTDLKFVLLAQFILFLIGSYFVGFHFYVMYWLVPYLTIFQSITWFIELSEHYPMIASANRDINATRNRFSHPVEAFLLNMHGENYHLIHHLFPGIPFWKLHQAHTILLQDKTYHQINSGFGGIFFSSNGQASMWSNLINFDFFQEDKGCDNV